MDIHKVLPIGPSPDVINLKEVLAKYSLYFDEDYISFISKQDGAEGEFGQGYLSIWPCSDILEVNAVHERERDFFSEYVLFASTGSFIYGRSRTRPIYVELDEMEEGYSRSIATTFSEVLKALLKDRA